MPINGEGINKSGSSIQQTPSAVERNEGQVHTTRWVNLENLRGSELIHAGDESVHRKSPEEANDRNKANGCLPGAGGRGGNAWRNEQ